eukprot:9208279-Alexandrium_andersonii.AAC.1
MGGSEFCGFRAAERAVWPVGRAWTSTSQGRFGAQQLTWTRGSSECAVVPTHETLEVGARENA